MKQLDPQSHVAAAAGNLRNADDDAAQPHSVVSAAGHTSTKQLAPQSHVAAAAGNLRNADDEAAQPHSVESAVGHTDDEAARPAVARRCRSRQLVQRRR